MEKVADKLNAKMNYTAVDDHVPEAEHNNHVIAERIRATYHKLPYKALPHIMIHYLAMVCTHQLNLFPVKGGVSEYFSPYMILSGWPFDYNKHCQVPFKAYVQACNENNLTNTNAPRTIDAIYLCPIQNIQGGHELMDLNSGKLVTRHKITEIPITQTVIKAIEAMAFAQGFKNLKFKNWHGIIFHPTNWIAGVEYEDDKNSNNQTFDEMMMKRMMKIIFMKKRMTFLLMTLMKTMTESISMRLMTW